MPRSLRHHPRSWSWRAETEPEAEVAERPPPPAKLEFLARRGQEPGRPNNRSPEPLLRTARRARRELKTPGLTVQAVRTPSREVSSGVGSRGRRLRRLRRPRAPAAPSSFAFARRSRTTPTTPLTKAAGRSTHAPRVSSVDTSSTCTSPGSRVEVLPRNLFRASHGGRP